MNPQQPNGQPQQPTPGSQLPTPAAQPWTPPSSPAPSGPVNTQGPEQQYGQVASQTAGDQYNFILSPEKKTKNGLQLGGSSSLMMRIILALSGVVVLVIIAVVVMSLLNGKSGSTTNMISVAQDQTELIRVAKLSTSQTTTQTTQNFATSLTLSIASDNQLLLTYLANNHLKLNTKQLGLKRDTRTDTQLQTAAAASNFDSTFMSALQTQLTTYERDLKAAYAAKPGPKGEALLNNEYNNAELLLKQTKQQ